MLCPDCGSDLMRSSTRRGPVDWAVAMLGMRPYRCQLCRRRVYNMDGAINRRYQPSKTKVREVRVAAATPSRNRVGRSRREWSVRFGRFRLGSREQLLRQATVLTMIGVGLLIFFLAVGRD